MAVVTRENKDGTKSYGVVVSERVDGKRRQRWLGTYKRKKDALAVDVEAKREIRMRGFVTIQGAVSIEALADDYLRTRALSPASVRLHGDSRRRMLEYFGKGRSIGSITRRDAEGYAMHISKLYSEVGVDRDLRRVRAWFNAAIGWGMVNESPFAGVRGGGTRPARHRGALDQAEIGCFLTELAELADDRTALTAQCILLSGMRVGEARGLRKVNVNLADGVVYIREQMDGSGSGITSTPKTESSIRDIELSPLGVESFRAAMADSSSAFVFQTAYYESMSTTFQNHVRNAFDAIGLEWASTHTLRHTFGSMLVEGGAPLTYVQKQMGHSKLSMTLDTYTHLISDSGHAATLDKWLA